MKKNNFKISKKDVEKAFYMMFLFELINALGCIIFFVMNLVGGFSIDVVSYIDMFVTIFLCGIMFVCARLAHNDHITVKIFWIIFVIYLIYVFFGGYSGIYDWMN